MNLRFSTFLSITHKWNKIEYTIFCSWNSTDFLGEKRKKIYKDISIVLFVFLLVFFLVPTAVDPSLSIVFAVIRSSKKSSLVKFPIRSCCINGIEVSVHSKFCRHIASAWHTAIPTSKLDKYKMCVASHYLSTFSSALATK